MEGQVSPLAAGKGQRKEQPAFTNRGQPLPGWLLQADPDSHPAQGGFVPAMPPDGKVGWPLEGSHVEAVLPVAGRARRPWLLSKCSVSSCGQEGILTPLQDRPSLASLPAPGEQPGALSKADSPLATPQLLRLPVKNHSSPSLPRGCSPAFWLPSCCWRG